MEQLTTFDSVIKWLASGGGAVLLVSWLSSWLLEEWGAWHTLPAKGKTILILVISVVFGVGGQVLILHPDFYAVIKPYLDTVVLVVGAWLTTQVAHKASKK